MMHRILVANQPRVWRGMLRRALERRPNLRVVGEVGDPNRLRQEVEQAGADWVIVSLGPDGALPAPVGPLLAEFPRLRFLGVASDGSQLKTRSAAHEERFDDPKLDDLIGVLSRDGLAADVQGVEAAPARQSQGA